jgi:hypothetical protein
MQAGHYAEVILRIVPLEEVIPLGFVISNRHNSVKISPFFLVEGLDMEGLSFTGNPRLKLEV